MTRKHTKLSPSAFLLVPVVGSVFACSSADTSETPGDSATSSDSGSPNHAADGGNEFASGDENGDSTSTGGVGDTDPAIGGEPGTVDPGTVDPGTGGNDPGPGSPDLGTDLLAFPGAEGFGRDSKGGRGGDVYHVTNLDDDGAGSLREGIESATGPRTIVFDLSGTIRLKDKLSIKEPNITIAGQTAPGDGITLRDYGLSISADDVVVRFIRSRLGDAAGEEADSISVKGGNNIIVDHCSVSWSVDEALSTQSDTADNVTVQWCMITESLHDSIHESGPHGMGGIVGALRQTFHHNLYAHHNSRNPKVTWRHHCDVDFRNNVIYNWGSNSAYDGSVSNMNWVNNYYKAGPATKSGVRNRIFELQDKNDSPDADQYEASLYAAGNYVDQFPSVTADNWNGGIHFDSGTSEAKNRALTPFDYPPIAEQSAEDAYPLVLSRAGASLSRDSLDLRIIQEVQQGMSSYGKSGIIDSQSDVGGWPQLESSSAPLDTDQDGMPDEWEVANQLDPTTPDNNSTSLSAVGYTALEVYLNSLVRF